MDYQTIYREVRAALDEKQAREAGLTAGEPLPLFVELEGYVRDILPAVQRMYDSLTTVQRLWLANGADQILAATDANGVPLEQGTLTAAEWAALQRLFKGLQGWAETPIHLSDDSAETPPGPVPLIVISQRPKTLSPAQMAARKER